MERPTQLTSSATASSLPEIVEVGDTSWNKVVAMMNAATSVETRRAHWSYLETYVARHLVSLRALVELGQLLDLMDDSLPLRCPVPRQELTWAIEDDDLGTVRRLLSIGISYQADFIQLAIDNGAVKVLGELVSWGYEGNERKLKASTPIWKELVWV